MAYFGYHPSRSGDYKVNWYDEELDKFYGDHNKGLVWGIYSYIEEDIVEVNWFKTEEERDKIFLERKE
tara:strand:+ start:335 stop:538 length:204 start_codon:yes stop_codon:yes gene_type:complete